ncbi:MAG: nucleotidyltransferase domain-containing protein [Ignavibacteriaceae bacterium]|nr:nucleotidyltransferase domain-containing protein [Ignavibacteriaceae bacterium]
MFGLKEENINNINHIFASFPEVEEVIIFGSRSKGTHKRGSDIDLVITKGDVEFTLLNKLTEKLDDLLLPYHIDLCLFSLIDNPDLIEQIKRAGKIFYTKA